jgi:zinc transport system ATP-binding protein
MNTLEISQLTVTYGPAAAPVISDISFSVADGQIVSLIGPNGSGKTTLIRAILGFVPYRGSVRIFGNKIDAARNKIGYVPQRFQFDETVPITVAETISMPALLEHVPDLQQKIDETAAFFGIADLTGRHLGELSGGQLQRVLLARSLVTGPQLLILDEPESGVDVSGEQKLYEMLKHLVETKHITVLIASHELDIVFQYSSHVICINRRLVCSGPPRDVITKDTLYELYGVNVSMYQHHHQ